MSGNSDTGEPEIRDNLLKRLQWDVAGPLSGIEIATGPPNQLINESLLDSTLGHEPLYDRLCNRIDEIIIRDFSDREDRDIYYPKEERYKGPPALEINNEDGRPITLRQFVTEAHAYVARNMEELRRVLSTTYGELIIHEDGTREHRTICGRPVKLPDDLRIFFAFVMAFIREKDGKNVIIVRLIAEGGPLWSPSFWANRQKNIK
jgi:hypothetical protein